MRYSGRWLIPIVGVILATSSCDCDDRIRQMISNPGDRKQQVEQAKKRRKKSKSSAPTEREPNDVAGQATAFQLGSDLRPIEASFDKPGDVDWFALTARGAKTWRVEVSVRPSPEAAQSVDPVIAVHGDQAGPTVYNVAGPGEPETIPALSVSSAQQRLEVSGADGTTGSYEVSFKKRLSAGAIEAEPNDHVQGASRFEAPGEIEGFYDRPGDRDIYFIAPKRMAGGVFNLEVTPVAEVVQQVEVFTNRDLKSAYLTFQVPPGRAAGLPNVGLPDDVDGLWLVLEAGDTYNRNKSYRVRLLAQPPGGPEVEAEPNDTAGSGYSIEPGVQLAGYFHAPEDVDYFRIYVDGIPDENSSDTTANPPSSRRDAGAESTDKPDAEAPLVDPRAGVDEATGPPDPLEAVADKIPPDHVIRVTAEPTSDEARIGLTWADTPNQGSSPVRESDEAGAPVVLCNKTQDSGFLDVEVRPVDVPNSGVSEQFDYRLAVEDVQTQSGLEVEPNDTRQEADKLVGDDPRVGYIGQANDLDVYAFAVAAETPRSPSSGSQTVGGPARGRSISSVESHKVRVELGANSLNLAFQLVDQEGGRVAQVNRAGAGGKETLEVDLPAGLYFIEVSSERAAGCDPYTLTVQRR